MKEFLENPKLDNDQVELSLTLGRIDKDGRLLEDDENTKSVARSLYTMGKIYYDKADLDLAEKYFVHSLSTSDRSRDVFLILKTMGFLIRIFSEKMENDKATYYISEAEKLVGELTSILGSLNAEYFYNLGLVNTYKGSFEEAKKHYLLACKKSKEENEPELLAKCLLALAINSYNTKVFDLSLDYLDQLKQLLKIIDKHYLCGSMFLLTAKVYIELEEFDKSIEFLKKSAKYLQEKKCWNLYGHLLLWRGVSYKKKGDFDKSLVFFNMGLESIDSNNFRRLDNLLMAEIEDVNDSNVDIYLDRTNRKVFESTLGLIDFKHRFVLLEILFLLAKNSGEYYDKESLAKAVWKDEYNPLIHDKLIYTSVSRLRKLIEPKAEKGQNRKYIVRGKDGYTFNPHAKIRFHFNKNIVAENSIGNVDVSSPV